MTEQQNGNSGEEQKPASDQLVAVEVQAPPPEQQRGPSREELIEALQKSREEAKALRDRMLRVLADVDNQRKRLAREREEIVKFGQEKLLRELLPVLDNLERSLQHLPADSQDVAVAGLRNGVQMVLNQMLAVLQNFGLKQFSAAGKSFDPQIHEAIERRSDAELPPDTIIEEIAKGFMLHERVLRPSLVVVSTRPEGENQQAQKETGEGE
jgi:molecular chaperone GrpE